MEKVRNVVVGDFVFCPKDPDPSKLAILRNQALRTAGSFTLPLEGQMILRLVD